MLTIEKTPDTYWELPSPLKIEVGLPYPIDALPAIIKNAVTSYQQYGQQPLPLIACSALANVSLACQTLANVARDNLLISPVSLYFLVIAASGERKSAADKVFGQAIREWEQKTTNKLESSVKTARILHHAWRVEKNALLTQIKRAATDGFNTNCLKNELVVIMEEEPIIPLLPMLFFEDTTQEAITSQLAHGWPSASLWSDEGSIVLNGQGLQNNTNKFISTLNRLWDGNPFITHRKTTRSFVVTHRRLTVSLMLQPLILQQLLNRNDGISRQSGFLARSLITYPESNMGERYYQEPPTSLSGISAFNQRLTDCLDASLTLDISGCKDIPTLPFSSNAKNRWVLFFNEIEKGLTSSNQWLTIKDFASKAAENAARLSALFHLFEGKTGVINSETVDQAVQVITWHLWETKHLLNIKSNPNQQQDAILLIQWLKNKGLTQTTGRYLQQFSPIRDKRKRDNAIQHLIATNHLKEVTTNGSSILLVNPAII